MPRSVQIFIGGGGVLQTKSNPKCQVLSKFSLGGTPSQIQRPSPSKFSRGRKGRRTPDQVKSRVPRSVEILIGAGGGVILQTESNPKCQDLSKFRFSFGWGWVGRGEGYSSTPGQLKSKMPRSEQIFIFGGRGGLQTNIPEIIEGGGALKEFSAKYLPS